MRMFHSDKTYNILQSEDKSHYDILFMLENHVAEANKIFKGTEFTLNQGLDSEEQLKGIQFEIRKIKVYRLYKVIYD